MRTFPFPKLRWLVFLIVLVCGIGLSCGDDDDDDDNDGGNFYGEIVGLVVGWFDGDPVPGATIRAMLGADQWAEAESVENGTFVLAEIPAASNVYVEFAKTGYCPMGFMVDTTAAEHDGAFTDVLVRAIPADAGVTIMVTAGGNYADGLNVTITPTSYPYKPTAETTNAGGRAAFEVGMGQSYEFAIPAFDGDGDGAEDFFGTVLDVDVMTPDETIYVNLAPVLAEDMELLSFGVDGVTAVALFTEWVFDAEILNAWADGVALADPPALMTAAGPQLRVTPDVLSGVLADHATVEFNLRVRGGSTGAWWTGTLRYEVESNDGAGGDPTCADVYNKMYLDCGYSFQDGDENLIPLEQIIAFCEADERDFGLDEDLAQCIWVSDCDDLPDCA